MLVTSALWLWTAFAGSSRSNLPSSHAQTSGTADSLCREHLRSTTANNLSEEDIEAIIGSIDIYDIGLGEASPPERDEGSDSGEMGEATTSPPNLSTEPDDVETRKTEDTDEGLLL